MADDEERARPLPQEAFQPENALHVEVIGGFVHQEDVGFGRQLAGDGQPLLPAPRERVDVRASVREAGAAESLRETTGPILLVHAGQRRHHDVLDGAIGGEDGVLGHVSDTDAAAQRAGAAVGRRIAGENPEERGLAGAVGADETGLVAFEQSERQIVEERPGPVGHADGLTTEQERTGHPTYFFFCLGFFFSFCMLLPFAMGSPPLVGVLARLRHRCLGELRFEFTRLWLRCVVPVY